MEGYLPTKEVCKRLNLEYATVMRLSEKYRAVLDLQRGGHGEFLWSPEAVEMLRTLAEDRERRFDLRQTQESKRYDAALRELRRHITESKKRTKDLEGIYRGLMENPPSVTADINTLPHPNWTLVHPITAVVSTADRGKYRAYLVDVDLWAEGPTRDAAVLELRHLLLSIYLDPSQGFDPEIQRTVQELIRPR